MHFSRIFECLLAFKMKKLIFVALLLGYQSCFCQVWSEDFAAESVGATSGTASGTPGGTWSVATAPSGTFSVQNVAVIGKSFFVDDTSTEGVWQSNVITLPSPGFASISVDLATGGTNSTDYIRCYYKVDGGAEILFAELLGQLINATTTGSAYVGGTTLQIVMRGQDNQFGTFFGLPLGFTMDNLTITAAPALYSRKSSTWTDVTAGNSTWSAVAIGGSSCNCTPTATQVAVIGGGFTVTLPSSQSVGALSVKNTGIFQYNTNGTTLTILEGLVRVESGGTINSSGAGITGEQLAFNADLPGAAIQVDAGGSVSLQDLVLSSAATNLHYINGGGTLAITGDILINASNATLTNNFTGTLTLSGRLYYGATGTITGSTFITNQALSIPTVLVNDNADNNNVLTIPSGITLTLGAVNLNDANFTINNSGTINQSGNFTNVDTGSNGNFNNLATGVWNWSYVPGTAFDSDMATVLDCSAAGNTFNYNGAGNQTIIAASYSNLSISVSGTKQPSATLDVNGNLTLQNSAVLNSNTQNINLAGNWSVLNTASFTEGTQTVTFDGSGTQTISNASGETFYNLTLSLGATANTVQLSNPITVSNTLTLTQGGLDINGQQLNITRNATAAMSAAANGYLISATTASPYAPVVWNVRTVIGTFTFPFRTGAGGTSIPYVFNKTSAGTESATGQLSVATYATATNNTPFPSGVTNVNDGLGVNQSANVADRFWIVAITGYSTLPTANVTFNIASAERPTGNPTLWAQRWTGTQWAAPITPSAASSTSVTISVPLAQMVSSPWTLVNNSVKLPIELLDFSAILKNGAVEVSWSTASELNNDFFTIERTDNLEHFEKIIEVKGSGTTRVRSNYHANDDAPLPGRSFYRLKQTDFDGRSSYSDVREIYNQQPFQVLIYPNPATDGVVTLEVKGGQALMSLPISLVTANGRSVFEAEYMLDAKGYLKGAIDLKELPSGLYIIDIKTREGLKKKILIQ